MSSPAERYAASRRKGRGELAAFTATYDFDLDRFQLDGCEAIEAGNGVLVAAPTGAGKTVVGEFAVHLALARGQKAFYTTPIKALSNQKYHELVATHGHDNVGLLTGDVSVNGEAPVVVMTTEVLRNMIYAGSTTLDTLAFVVMDEVHYLADRFRGAVWEEVIIHLPRSVQVISLSATVSNAEEFGDWLAEVRGGTEVVVTEERPVPLWQHMQVGRDVHDLFVDEEGASAGAPTKVNPELLHAIREKVRGTEDDPRLQRGGGRGGRDRRGGRERRGGGRNQGGQGRQRGGGGRFGGAASRTEVIRELDRDGLLPAITFIFSRAGCDGAVTQLLANDVRLVSEREGERNRRTVEERAAVLEGEDLDVLGYHQFVAGIAAGFAAHHAGMLPLFREIVEELFTAGRIRAVFATETLALGINMPARTVVLEKLVKFNGESHVEITPAEYTQLTGRAGRRGIDVEGHALVVWSRGLDPMAVAGLASTRTYPLHSSFKPTYNMAVNLVAQVGRQTAKEVLETSFAQFQADRAVVGLATKVREQQDSLDAYAEAMHCHLGDFREYAALRRRITDVEKEGKRRRGANRRAEIAVSLEALRVGDVIRIGGRRSGLALVIAPPRSYKGEESAPTVLTEHKQVRRLVPADLDGPVAAFGKLTIPRGFNPKSTKQRTDLATTLRIKAPDEQAPSVRTRATEAAKGEDEHLAQLRRQLKEHPCHQCPEREVHARWAQRWWKLKRETSSLQRKVEHRTNSVAQTFERICVVLTRLGYLDDEGESVSELGGRLRRLYTEKDLLAAECLGGGAWSRLDPAELAAVVSMLVHEPRREEHDPFPRLPTDGVSDAWQDMLQRWSELEDLESEHALPQTGEPDGGIAWAVHRWASGRRLDEVLSGSDLTAGDFVRRCKQIVDLLGQVADAAPEPHLRTVARKSVDKVRRGVVAADRLD
ncbi:DEAD/DEAH box helicase [Janibacter cremeus]|uniref:ATP-dependent RNA helicase HelY n=1 Tax=Janibacter cremeus TaxID=1285192 RepID=A0A852VL17_9MICO|nr:DEAD/DEAH box helicase [Janibacter cremeus]NYF96629.1 ATP-dependent RNA helicase HelY [Janibacter cremeus]